MDTIKPAPKPELKSGTYWDGTAGRYLEPEDPDWDAQKFGELVGNDRSGVWEKPRGEES